MDGLLGSGSQSGTAANGGKAGIKRRAVADHAEFKAEEVMEQMAKLLLSVKMDVRTLKSAQ
eukprot:2934410-Karenia_brevis.AAC.1